MGKKQAMHDRIDNNLQGVDKNIVKNSPFNKIRTKFREPLLLPKTIPLYTMEAFLSSIYKILMNLIDCTDTIHNNTAFPELKEKIYRKSKKVADFFLSLKSLLFFTSESCMIVW